MKRINYPAIEVYKAIDGWLDGLKGKSLDPDSENPITRGDIGELNSRIQAVLEYNNWGTQVVSTNGLQVPDGWDGWPLKNIEGWKHDPTDTK